GAQSLRGSLGRIGVRPSLHPATSTMQRLSFACTMASISELTCIYSALILHNYEALANVNIGCLICKAGAGGPAYQLGRHQQEVLPPPPLLPQLKRQWQQRKKTLRSLMMTGALGFLTEPLL
ncbi:hypothetical protein E2I00_007800, partial [Balaenoptera physalus]